MKNQQKDQLNQIIKSSVTPVSKTKFPIDDYTQYLPTAAFLSLDYMGIKSKHNLKQKLYAGSLSHIIMAATVNIMKAKIHIMRPDQSSDNSFPSGHTATAFVGAELLWQEYHHLSPWYGIAGYTIASATGFFRMYNNKHWFSDVTMGAGIGILSTKLGYWLMPKFERMFSKKENTYTILPTYQNNTFGLTYRQIL
ncbi:phosphatase PAP2 family protein [Sphingobacterium bovistauri]|nr:phosphatase PAP2 family protein [Sphingobacterium bovistauri]